MDRIVITGMGVLSPAGLTLEEFWNTLVSAKPGDTFQFLRNGYFCKDPDSTDTHPVYNRPARRCRP